MIDARLSEAEYSLVSAEQSYEVALHNFNILRGTDAALGAQLAQGIRDSLPMPGRVVAAEALERRPDYAAARLRSEQAEAGIRAVRAPFNPQLSVGVGGMWQPYYPNSTGATYVDGSAFVKLSVPIFRLGRTPPGRGGRARRAVAAGVERRARARRHRARGDERLDGPRAEPRAGRRLGRAPPHRRARTSPSAPIPTAKAWRRSSTSCKPS